MTIGGNRGIRRNAFRIAAGVLVLGAVAHVATAWPGVTALSEVLGAKSWMIVTAFGVAALTALAACGLAVLLLWKAADRPDARALTLFLGFLAIFWGSLFRFMNVDLASNSVSVNLSYGGGWVSQTALASLLLAFASFLRFSALFPRPLTADRLPPSRFPPVLRRARLAFLRPTVAWGGPVLLLLLLHYLPPITHWAADLIGPPDPSGTRGYLTGIAVALWLIVAYGLAAMAMGARNLRDSYRTATSDERERILWVVTGFSAAWWMMVGCIGLIGVTELTGLDTSVLAAAIPVALLLAPLLVVAGAAVGILYSGAIDPALALEKSTLYGLLGVLGVVGFAAIENGLSDAVEEWVHLPGFVGSMIAGGLVTVALIPVRRAIKLWMGRRDSARLP